MLIGISLVIFAVFSLSRAKKLVMIWYGGPAGI